MLIKRLFSTIFLAILIQSVWSRNIDSLKISLNNSKEDSSKVKYLNLISQHYIDLKDIVQANKYTYELYKLAVKNNSKKQKAQSYYKIGQIYQIKHKPDSALIFHLVAMKMSQEINYLKGYAQAYLKVRKIYESKYDIKNFVKYTAFKPTTEEKLEEGIVWMYSGFFIFFSLYNLFLYAFSKDKAYLYMSLAVFFYEYFNEFCQQENQFFAEYELSVSFAMFGILFISPFITTFYFNKFFIEILKSEKKEIKEITLYKTFNKFILILCAIVLSIQLLLIFIQDQQFSTSMSYFNFIYYRFDEIGLLFVLTSIIIILKIKLTNKVQHLNFVLVGVICQILGMILSEIGSNANIHWINVLSAHSLGVSLFLLFLSAEVSNKINLFRLEKENALANALVVLEEKVKERTLEVQTQKQVIEEKHKEITDSINYAERIQKSFMATDDLLSKNLNEFFILFKPKDIVSGDFYWASSLNDGRFSFVTADSTGHGVPGAIMSLLNITSLEKAVEKFTDPSAILNETRKTIINRLKNDGSKDGGKDGMDCSILVFDKTNKLSVSTAYNPVWIVRNTSVIEIPADKMPVGKHDQQHISFNQHEIQLEKGDVIYTLTDGFPDQFGGEKGKKFMSKRLREMLVNIAVLPMQEQKQILLNTLENWIGNLEQVDDITIVGIRF